MLMKKYIVTLWAVALMLLTAACGGSGSRSAKRLAVSIEPQRYLLEHIAGDRWEVVTLLEKGSDPENFDPTVSLLRSVSEADAYFIVGTMDFEKSVAGRLSSGNPDIKIVDTSKGIELLTGTHSHRGSDGSVHTHTVADPHTWSSLPNAIVMATNMCDALVEIDPDNAAIYRANCDTLVAQLEAVHRDIAAELVQSPHRWFLIWHPSLSYFARDYSLEQISLGDTNRELSPLTFKNNIDIASNADSIVMFTQTDYDYNRSDAVARQARARTVEINQLDYDFVSGLQTIAKEIAR